MRQLIFRVPRGEGGRIIAAAEERGGVNLSTLEAKKGGQLLDLVFVYVSNREVESLMLEVKSIADLHVVLQPSGTLPLHPPTGRAAQQVLDIQPLSPLEVFLSGLQSIGSWTGFLGYAAAAAVVAWIGLYTNTTYLLVAAMLIAPLAGPATNVALATARGDMHLFRRSLLRYVVALLIISGLSALLSLVLGQRAVTTQMVDISSVSVVAILLPLVAGGAGALSLMQSDNSSLVSGAAVGMLVAASLAPPTAVIGMATALGRWEMVLGGLFVVTLQLFGINLAGSLVFRTFEITVEEPYFSRGNRLLFPINLTVTVLALAGLLTLQLSSPPNLVRSSLAQRVSYAMQQAVNSGDVARTVQTSASFTRANIPGQETLLGIVYAERRSGVQGEDATLERQLEGRIERRLQSEFNDFTPLVNVELLEPPE